MSFQLPPSDLYDDLAARRCASTPTSGEFTALSPALSSSRLPRPRWLLITGNSATRLTRTYEPPTRLRESSADLPARLWRLISRPRSIPLAGAWGALYKGAEELGPLINLAQGVPGAPPPEPFMDKLKEASADTATTGYGDLRGDTGLRKALAEDIQHVYDEGISADDEVVITSGANLGFYSAMVSLAGAGDEIILPTPW